MTFVLAARCMDGVVVAGDTRVWDEPDTATSAIQRKVDVAHERYVVGFAGTQYPGQCFIDSMKEPLEDKPIALLSLVEKAEVELKHLAERYSKPDDDKDDDKGNDEVEGSLETFLVGPNADGKVQIYYIRTKEAPHAITSVSGLGYGWATGRGALTVLWDEDMTVDQAWRLAAVVMKVVSSQHCSVGGIPNIYLVKDNNGAQEVPFEEVEAAYKAAEEVLKAIPGNIRSEIDKWLR